MALQVGELNGILSIDDRAVDPALRRAENALRSSGQRMGDDADRAGRQVGEGLGDGIVRGADGSLRDARGRFVAAGRRAGDDVGEGLNDGAGEGADGAARSVGDRMRGGMQLAMAGVGAAAGAMLMDAFGQAMEQGQIVGKMQAQMGATPAVAQKYGKLAGELFKDAIVTDFQQGADAINVIASAGLFKPDATNAQIKSLATNAADLANSFDVDLTLAAQAAGSMLKNGLAKNGQEAFDLLAAGMTGLGPASDDLMETFTEYGPVFKAAGISGQTALGLIRQAIQGGWTKDTDKIGDAFKEFQLRATEGSKGVQAAFKSLGLDAKKTGDDIAAGGKTGEKAMDNVLDRIKKLGPNSQEARQIVSTLFGGPGEDLGAALFALDIDKASTAMGNAAGSADKLGNGLRDNAATKVAQFKNSLQQNLVEFLGNEVIPRLSGFFDFAKNNSGLLGGLAASVIALGTAFTIASIGVWAMNSAMLANPIFWIIAGIAAGVAGVVILIVTYWDEIKAATTTAWSWVTSKISGAVAAVLGAVAWLGSLPGKVASWWQGVKDKTVQIATAWVAWVAGLPGRVWSAISGLQNRMQTAATNAFVAFRNAAAVKAAAFIGWVKGLPGRIASGIGSLNKLLVTKGVQVVQGLWSGIQSMGSWIYDKLIGWAKSMIPGPIAKALGIASPSKVTRAQGRWIARGLIAGMTGSSKQVRAASTKLADIVRDSLNPGKKRSRALGVISAGTKKLLKLAGQEDRLAARMKTATKKLADQIKARDKLAADVKKGVLDGANITQQDTGGWPQTAETILAGLRADTQAAQTFAKNLATLRKKGVRADLIAQIAQAGVEQGSSAAAALANASKGQITAINQQQKALVTAAGQAGSTAGNAMYGAGINAAQGLIRGLKSQQKAIDRQMLAIAKSMSKSIRKALGIKSPSKVMALVGSYTGQGLREGIESERRAVNRSMASLVETPAPGSWDTASARARAAASQRIVLELRSSGRGEDNYLMGRVRRSIRKVGGPDAQFALTGTRSS
jgi:hypothetical protein